MEMVLEEDIKEIFETMESSIKKMHGKTVLITGLEKDIAVVCPEQRVCPPAGLITATGIGFTIIEIVVVIPLHPLTEGVIAYTASPEELVTVFNIWAITFPVPIEPPVTLF